MSKNIGFIGGGQMAEAIVKGLLQSKVLGTSRIAVTEPVEPRKAYLKTTYSVQLFDDPTDLCSASDLIILAVKPQVMPAVLKQISEHVAEKLVITVAAGLPITFYEQELKSRSPKIIRVMPNMPALIQQGASALCRNSNVSDDDFAFVISLFETIGSTVCVPEIQMDAVTGLSGSGPAFVFSFIEAMIDAGVKIGLNREVARNLTLQTIAGAVQLAQLTEEHPAVLRDRVTSPGGTTASGLHVLEEHGFNGNVISAIEASCNRSIELGNRP